MSNWHFNLGCCLQVKAPQLASWYSFEDPGPLPPMPNPAMNDPISTAEPAAAVKLVAAATTKQPETQPSIDAWATPVEPSTEVKAAESAVLASSLAGLDGDAWGGSSFGPDMGLPMSQAPPGKSTAEPVPMGKPKGMAEPALKAPAELAKSAEGETFDPTFAVCNGNVVPFSRFSIVLLTFQSVLTPSQSYNKLLFQCSGFQVGSDGCMAFNTQLCLLHFHAHRC